ncbi:coiled-coil domain-containing protein 55-domain containing protein [Fomitopsis serialis]|uniref:coiled-coil domain-containing protein 55-domain containing protein n=1 Tax=Fomitopsis serialis TaxID=139415 RepID=UPI0020081607|nr:coiled-coil domain-containing protein 55-domain containing protein [Neoantrodia serialis]KAH9926199.1 coiled-coil domain-containing protein 55-domain containing protein [Neoantrodia serialis]
MKVSFSLANSKAKAAAKPAAETPSLKRSAAFASLDDDEPVDAAPTASGNSKVAANKKLVAQNLEMSKTMKKRLEEEMKVDSSVFEYDAVWDKMQEVKMKQKEAKEVDSKERKPKYINNLLQTAATRRLDHLRAEQKMIQREREAEGDEFKDKEAFVTQAYKDQLAEMKRSEEEERQREEAEKKKNKGAGSGMAHFYRKLLEESEQQHEETVAAATTTKPVIGPQGPNLTITKPVDLAPKSDLDLAKAAKEQGKDVELNDDNQIVDKRDLLSAGLNLSAPNTRKFGLQKMKSSTNEEQAQVHRAAGTAASRKEINERRAREVAKQMEEERERLLWEKEQREQESINRVVAKRNTEEAVMSARERYLERKRRKLEEATANPEGET